MTSDRKYIVFTLVFKVLIAFASMGIVIITSQKLGADGRGMISYVLLLISLAQLVTDFIGGSTLINLAPKEKLINLLIPSYIAQVIVSMGLAVIFIHIVNLEISTLLVFLTCLLLGLVNINLSLILGRSFINTRNGIQLFYMLFSLFAVFIVYYVFESANVNDYFNILIFSYALGFLCSVIFLFRIRKKDDFEEFKWNPLLIKWGFWSQLSQVINLLNYRIMYFFIERDYDMAKLGVFGNAMTVGDMLKISGHSLGQVQHNRIITSKNLENEANRILPKYLALNFLLYGLQAIILILIPATFWVYLLGVDFSDLKNQIILLLPGFICMGISTSFSFHYHALSAFKKNLLVNFCTLLSFLIAYYFLKEHYEFNSIHISFSISFGVQLLIFVLLYLFDSRTMVGSERKDS